MNIFANVFSMFFNNDPLPNVQKNHEDTAVTESYVYRQLSSMDRVFYAYNDESDQVPFNLGDDDDDDDVGYENDIDDDFVTISHCPSVNVDGTPMLHNSCIDIHGNAYGITSDTFQDDSIDMMTDNSMIFEESSTDVFNDDSSDMFEDSFSSFDDQF